MKNEITDREKITTLLKQLNPDKEIIEKDKYVVIKGVEVYKFNNKDELVSINKL